MDTKGKQAKSWCAIYGNRREKKGLLAQVFFPTNVASLDSQDESVLDHLIERYKYALLGQKLNFQFVGFADFRGNAEYNKRLSGRRAQAVQEYVDKSLKPFSTYFSSSTVAMGEAGAGRKHIELDRRVEVLSSLVLPRPPIDLGEIVITGKVPPKMVKRPKVFLDIEWMRSDKTPGDQGGKSFHTIIVEKWSMIEELCSFAFNPRMTHTAVHSAFPFVKKVHRYIIDWRKPQPSDTGKKGVSVALDIIAGFAGAPGGIYDPSMGVPSVKPPNVVYQGWQEFAKENSSEAEDYRKYWMSPF